MNKCIGCEAFKKTNLKIGEKRKCFICGKINTKKDPISDLKDMFGIK